MHDFFDILGVPTNAAASEVRRACASRIRRSHPDFTNATPMTDVATAADLPPADVAIDFLDMRAFVDRIQAAFFAPGG